MVDHRLPERLAFKSTTAICFAWYSGGGGLTWNTLAGLFYFLKHCG